MRETTIAGSVARVGPIKSTGYRWEKPATPLEWQDDALCAQTGLDMFFPEKGGTTRDAKKVCGGCDVREQCLAYALENDEHFGIWGGTSERERRKLKKAAA